MANIKSQIKRARQNERRRVRNKAIRSALGTDARKVAAAVDEGDLEAATRDAQTASRALDRAVSDGVLSKRTAARRKSRIARAMNGAVAAAGENAPGASEG